MANEGGLQEKSPPLSVLDMADVASARDHLRQTPGKEAQRLADNLDRFIRKYNSQELWSRGK